MLKEDLNYTSICNRPLRFKWISSRILILSFFLILISHKTNCQEITLPERISEIAEEIASEENDQGNADIYSDLLYELSQDPVKLNSGDEKEISRLFFLTDFQIRILTDYVKASGTIVSVFEIANIPGFNREVAEMIRPFVTMESNTGLRTSSFKPEQSLLASFTTKSTEADTSLLGSQWRVLSKYKVAFKSFSAGFTTEKDPGEKYLSNGGNIPDFISGYLSYKGKGILRQVILGDYSAHFGQGSNINTQMRTSLSSSPTVFLSGRNEIRPYTSTDENRFFRGAGAALTYRNIDLDMFLSVNRIDATVDQTGDSTLSSVRSLYTSGVHNTEFYMSKKDVLKETDYGLHLSANFRNIRLGIVLSHTGFSFPVLADISSPENIFDFRGSYNNTGSIYINGLYRRFLFFSEASANGNGNFAAIEGLSFRPSSRLTMDILYRYYSPGFISFRGKGPARGSANSNETGLFEKVTFEAARNLFVSACADLSYFPWLSYRSSSPSMAKKFDIRFKYLPSPKLNIEAILSSKTTIADKTGENIIPRQNESVGNSVKLSLKYSPSDYFTLSSQVCYKIVKPAEGSGLMMLQDLIIKPEKLPVSVCIRYAIYNTGSYESGIYTWEQDLMNSFSVPVLYGNGSRSYVVLSWKLYKRVELRFKYGITSTFELHNRVKNVEEFRIQARLNL